MKQKSEPVPKTGSIAITEEQFDSVRRLLWGTIMMDAESLRYKVFDLGSLLIRGDGPGRRKEQWKNEVNDWFHQAMGLWDQALSTSGEAFKATLEGASTTMEMFYSELGHNLLRVGEMVFEKDQIYYYAERLGRFLYENQRWTASLIAQDLSALSGIKWKNRCFSHSNYFFTSEGEGSASPSPGVYAIQDVRVAD